MSLEKAKQINELLKELLRDVNKELGKSKTDRLMRRIYRAKVDALVSEIDFLKEEFFQVVEETPVEEVPKEDKPEKEKPEAPSDDRPSQPRDPQQGERQPREENENNL